MGKRDMNGPVVARRFTEFSSSIERIDDPNSVQGKASQVVPPLLGKETVPRVEPGDLLGKELV
jgi:hypothetical protein